MGRLAYLYHPLFEAHDPGAGHPESPQRLRNIQEHLDKSGLWDRLSRFEPPPASREVIGQVHSAAYISFILSRRGAEHQILDDGDTVINAHSVDAALLAAGAVVYAADLIFKDDYDKVFCAVRPPGHHAENDRAMGFCIFNNVAIGARYARDRYGIKNIMIIDWDLHHGNGTQHIFYDDPGVLYISLHQFPYYPGTGRSSETGDGEGTGYTINLPLAPGSDDSAYTSALEQGLARAEQIMQPGLLIISAGFDAHQSDPLGAMQVSAEGFYKMTELVCRFAQKHCQGRVISVLEGGYSHPGLAESVLRHLQCFLKH
jgi:acetoin utilization deacetylase AcuC-like enzyme